MIFGKQVQFYYKAEKIQENMMRALVAYTATLCLYTGVHSQPIECKIDDQCQSGFFCDPDAYACRKCLNCVQLNRDPPRSLFNCTRSITDCGACIKGFVEDLRGDVSAQCVPGDARGADSPQPAYVWAAVAVGLALFVVLLVATAVYSLRNINTLKIMASTRTSVQSQCAGGAGGASGACPAASAPELPPAYEAHYSSRPASPPALVQDYDGEDSSWPFIKRAPGARAARAREAAGSQAARPYSNPHYVRGPQLPPGYDGTSADEADEEERGVFAHDEDTMESAWTPAAQRDDGGNAAGAAGALAGLLGARAPLCSRQETDGNRNASETLGAGENNGNGPSNVGPSFIINVVQNINTVQQQNDVTL